MIAFIQINFLGQITSIDVDIFNIKLITKSEVTNFVNNNTNLIIRFFATKANKSKIDKKKVKKLCKLI